MAIPNIIRGRGGIVDLLKRGKYKDSLPSPLDPPLAGGGGGGGVVGAFICNVLINYLAKTPVIPNNST